MNNEICEGCMFLTYEKETNTNICTLNGNCNENNKEVL